MLASLQRLFRVRTARASADAQSLTRFEQVDSDGLGGADCKGSQSMRVGADLAADFADTRPAFAKAVDRRRRPRA